MPEYDAFGREVGEDPLAALRAGDETPSRATQPASAARRTPEHETVVAAPPAQPRASTAFPEHRTAEPLGQRGSGSGGAALRGIVLLVVLAALVPVGFGIYSVVDSVNDTVNIVDDAVDSSPAIPGIPREAQKALEDATEAAPAEAGEPPASDPVGLQRGSMLTRAELSRALRALRRYGRVRLLRVAPARVDAQMVTPGGQMTLVQIRPGGAAQVISSVPRSGGGPELVRLAQINAAAPFRLTRSAAGRLRRPTSQVDYAVMLSFGGAPQWSVFFKGGRAFQGDVGGRVIRRIQ